MSTLCLLGTGAIAVNRAGQNSTVVMCLEGKRPPLNLNRTEVGERRTGGEVRKRVLEEQHVQRSRGRRN